MSFEARVQTLPEGLTNVALIGNLIDDEPLPEVPESVEINLDLDGLIALNSLGIRTFMIWAHALRCQSLFVRNCQPVFVRQLTLIADFLPAKAEIQSFYVPFWSEETDEEKAVLYLRDVHFFPGTKKLAPPDVFDSEGNAMVPGVSATYFNFLK